MAKLSRDQKRARKVKQKRQKSAASRAEETVDEPKKNVLGSKLARSVPQPDLPETGELSRKQISRIGR